MKNLINLCIETSFILSIMNFLRNNIRLKDQKFDINAKTAPIFLVHPLRKIMLNYVHLRKIGKT